MLMRVLENSADYGRLLGFILLPHPASQCELKLSMVKRQHRNETQDYMDGQSLYLFCCA
jgi:hypothetical protein